MAKLELLLNDFQKALTQFDGALIERTDDELKQTGCIRYFEFCFELAWKTVKAFFEYKGLLECNSPRECMKLAFKSNLINDEYIWIEMLEKRNITTHTYNFDTALNIYKNLPDYLTEMKALLNNLQTN